MIAAKPLSNVRVRYSPDRDVWTVSYDYDGRRGLWCELNRAAKVQRWGRMPAGCRVYPGADAVMEQAQELIDAGPVGSPADYRAALKLARSYVKRGGDPLPVLAAIDALLGPEDVARAARDRDRLAREAARERRLALLKQASR